MLIPRLMFTFKFWVKFWVDVLFLSIPAFLLSGFYGLNESYAWWFGLMAVSLIVLAWLKWPWWKF